MRILNIRREETYAIERLELSAQLLEEIVPLIKHRVSSPRCVSPSSSSGLSLANSLTRSCGKNELPTRQYTVLNYPYRSISINVPQVINLNIERRDCLVDFLLA